MSILDFVDSKTAKKSDSDFICNQVFQDSEVGLIVLDDQSRLVQWNPWINRHASINFENFKGKAFIEIFPELKDSRMETAIKQAIEKGMSSFMSQTLNRKPLPLRNLLGRPIEQHIYIKPIVSSAGLRFCLIQIADVTSAVIREKQLIEQAQKNKDITQKLAQEKDLAQITLNAIADAVITTDKNGLVLSMNPVAEILTGTQLENGLNQPIAEVFVLQEDSADNLLCPVRRCLQTHNVIYDEEDHTLLARNGLQYAINDSVAPIFDENHMLLGTVLVFRDVTKARALSAKLTWQALHDPLTGLSNRRSFEANLRKILEFSKTAPGKSVSHLLYLDLDQFKVVNDTCGHDAGDELLKQISRIFRDHLRKSDILARLGGDEFGVLLEGCGKEDCFRIANEIRKAIQDFRFGWKNQSFKIGVSIGISSITGYEAKASEILSAADAACYAAKEKGRNRVHFHELDETGSSVHQQEMQWIAKIQAALDENRFKIYVQKIQKVGGVQRNNDHYEILLRMIGKDGEIIPPGAFLPAAERYGLMASIDRWVVDNVVIKLAELHRRFGLEQLPIFAINLSGASLADNSLLEHIMTEIASFSIPPEKLCFEVTETAAIGNLSEAVTFLSKIRESGCKIALDDFGSGLSSFAYLKSLPVDYLKIDGHFVKDIVSDPIDRVFVESINQIAHVMELETIAEFVENKQIADLLSSIGVDFIQGYEVHKPCPFEETALYIH